MRKKDYMNATTRSCLEATLVAAGAPSRLSVSINMGCYLLACLEYYGFKKNEIKNRIFHIYGGR